MTGQIADRKTVIMGAEDNALPVLLTFPVAASTTIYAGSMVAVNAAGYAVPASASPGLKVVGRCERTVINQATGGSATPDGIGNGNAGSVNVRVHQGAFYYDLNTDGGTFSIASFGQNVFAVDDHTLSLSDAGGTRPYAGYTLDGGGTMTPPKSLNQVGVMLGVANPFALNPELGGASAAFKARAVVTTLQAYTGSGTNVLTETANGAISAADGVTLAAGDVVFIQAGTTNLTGAVDSGPWTVTSLGGAGSKWVLTRPDWFTTGAAVQVGQVIDIGGEGAIWKGTQWKSFAATSANVIGTNDPTFYVGRVTQQITLVASASTISNVGLLSATKTGIEYDYTGTGAIAGTVGYGQTAAITPGYIGTGSVAIAALASGMTKNGTTDVSVVNVTIVNW